MKRGSLWWGALLSVARRAKVIARKFRRSQCSNKIFENYDSFRLMYRSDNDVA